MCRRKAALLLTVNNYLNPAHLTLLKGCQIPQIRGVGFEAQKWLQRTTSLDLKNRLFLPLRLLIHHRIPFLGNSSEAQAYKESGGGRCDGTPIVDTLSPLNGRTAHNLKVINHLRRTRFCAKF